MNIVKTRAHTNAHTMMAVIADFPSCGKHYLKLNNLTIFLSNVLVVALINYITPVTKKKKII